MQPFFLELTAIKKMKNGFRIVLYCKCCSSEERGTSSLVGLDLLLFFLFKESTSYFPVVWAVKPLVIYHLGIPATASSLPDCTGHPRAHASRALPSPSGGPALRMLVWSHSQAPSVPARPATGLGGSGAPGLPARSPISRWAGASRSARQLRPL